MKKKLSNKRIVELDNLILLLSEKLSDIEFVRSKSSALLDYNYASIGVSYPALCILFSELHSHFPRYNFDKYAYEYLGVVNTYLERNFVEDISLFDGLCGVGFSAYCMSDEGKHYQSYIKKLNSYIIKIAIKLISEYKNLPLSEFSYDIMYGFTGVGNYLLNFKFDSEVCPVLLDILRYLSDICKINDEGFPNFLINSSDSNLFKQKFDNDFQYTNLGLSHGIPGILLLLSKAYNEGIQVNNQLGAIHVLSNYLVNNCQCNNHNIYWENQKIIGTKNNNVIVSRDAWCYGTPGVAYSLLRASKIVNNKEMHKLAIKSMKVALKRLNQVSSPTFCHGFSGICCIARKFHVETNDDFFYKSYMELFEKILSFYNNKNSFGFKDIEVTENSIVEKNEIGILTGTSGVILTLLACYRPVNTKWESIFLL